MNAILFLFLIQDLSIAYDRKNMVPQKVSKQPSYMFPICIAYFTIFLYLSKSVISIEHCADTCVFFFYLHLSIYDVFMDKNQTSTRLR